MNKHFVRFISAIMSLVMLFGVVPMTALAKNNDSDFSFYNNEYEINPTTSIGNILVNSSSDEYQNSSEYSFSDLSIDGKTAHVEFNNFNACTLVVAIYNEDNGQLLGSGIKAVDAYTFETDIDISIDTMPQYFLLKAFLLDSDMSQLCQPYTVIEHSKNFEEFDKKTIYDFADDVIINFDEQTDDNFAVLVDDAVEVVGSDSVNVLESYDDSTGKYVFKNINSDIADLKIGDVFTITTKKDVYVIKVKSIAVSENKATIYEESQIEYDDIFKYIDIDESSDSSGNDIFVDTSDADDCVEYVGLERWNTNDIVPNAIDEDATGSVSCPVWEGKDKYLAGSSTSTGSVKFSYKLKASIEYNIKVYFDAEWEWRWDIWNSYSDYFFFQMKIDFKVTGSVSLTGAVNTDVYLGDVGFMTPVGIEVAINVKIHLEASLSIAVTIDAITLTIGFKYDEDVGFQSLCAGPKISIVPEIEGKGEFKIGIALGPGISFVKVIEVFLDPECGVSATVTLLKVDFNEILNIKSVDEVHSCTRPCFDGRLDFYISCKLKGEIFGKKIGEVTLTAEKQRKLTDFYLRLNPFEISFNKCSNKAYRVTYKVLDKNGKAYSGVVVYSGAPILDGYNNISGTTNNNGEITFFYPTGNYSARFVVDGKEITAKSIHVVGYAKDIDVKLDIELEENDDVTGNTKWNYDSSTRTLTISGTGKMDNYPGLDQTPWAAYKDSITKVVIESGVTSIGDYAFAQLGALNTVVIPDTVKQIGTAAFYGCSNIREIALGKDTTDIGDYAFYYCYRLNKLTTNSKLSSIGAYAFAQCTTIPTVDLPATISNIGDGAFAFCSSLTSITIRNSDCVIYNSEQTISASAKIYGALGSTAQTYANKYGRSFSAISVKSNGVDGLTLNSGNEAIVLNSVDSSIDTYKINQPSCVPGESYILINVTGWGNNFVLTSDNLFYIDQVVADENGVVKTDFIPKEYKSNSTTLLIGNFGNGTVQKIVTIKKYVDMSRCEIAIQNPSTKTVNYGDTLVLQANISLDELEEGTTFVWTVDGVGFNMVPTDDGLTCYMTSVENGDATVKVTLVDENGDAVLDAEGNEIFAEITLKSNASFWQKIVSFFKNLFRINRIVY